ncbi:hypothetical protein XELAEV_18030407mg [Xenopus laevis]|uniref:Uncharacterized protein n=1 Tax=Xenopus laevis TaxID=8355 RepID=A0A974HEP9_XENLA|nr:hypothetical protein XELAEV_18030407mg [Xenopus laevis]
MLERPGESPKRTGGSELSWERDEDTIVRLIPDPAANKQRQREPQTEASEQRTRRSSPIPLISQSFGSRGNMTPFRLPMIPCK